MQRLNNASTLGSKLWRRAQDIPSHLAEIRDLVVPGEFAEFYRLVHPYTMCGRARLRRLHTGVRHVVEKNIPGDIVECGVAFGGSAALLGLTLKSMDAHRKLWAFDTFEGLPAPTEDDPDYTVANEFTGAYRSEVTDVSRLFERLGILENTVFVKGMFQDTVPGSGIGKIAVLHLDGDWYESVKVCLDHLYDRVSSGGIIQIDDYGHWAGARKAVDEFLDGRPIPGGLRYIDYSARQIIKP
ncbi:MAG: TylF/MycF/NovP-related O-methyltransferase [Pyrinomonadaceae bacterium]